MEVNDIVTFKSLDVQQKYTHAPNIIMMVVVGKRNVNGKPAFRTIGMTTPCVGNDYTIPAADLQLAIKYSDTAFGKNAEMFDFQEDLEIVMADIPNIEKISIPPQQDVVDGHFTPAEVEEILQRAQIKLRYFDTLMDLVKKYRNPNVKKDASIVETNKDALNGGGGSRGLREQLKNYRPVPVDFQSGVDPTADQPIEVNPAAEEDASWKLTTATFTTTDTANIQFVGR